MAAASRFVLLIDEQVKEFSESFDNENTKKEDLVRFKGFQRISRHLRREENKNGQLHVDMNFMCLPLEHKIHIFSPPCNILYIFIYFIYLFKV